MPKKRRPAKRQEESSFLTPDFLKEQRIVLEKKLATYKELQKSAQQGIKVRPSHERKGDLAEQAFTASEIECTVQQLDCWGKIIPLIRRALGLIDNSLTGEKSGEHYGICISCDRLMPKKRLTAIPEALRCVLCQGKKDATE